MDPFKPITSSITSTSFTFLTSAEVKALSVKQVQNPKLFDNTNVPTSGGLYDPAFGPTTHGDICPTCGLTSFNCPGHFGHIQLPFPVYNPLFMKNCFAVLRASCTNCHRFLATEAAASIVRYTAKLILLEHGLLTSAMSVDLFTAAGEEADKEEKKAKRKTGKGEETEEDTGEDIGAVHSSVEMLRSKVATWVDVSLRRVIATSQSTSSSDDAPKESYDRDAYKQSGSMVHDERRKLLASFFKESARNRCSHCEAHVHRLKKDGATKIVEFSLTKKQRDFQRARGIKRKNAAFLKRLADKSVGKRREGEESDEGF
ncbi:beta and beta-prime subunits of DNA dependent RNA-polymerase, partial [Atractiella rhizophila]